jgi:hypothetical protein
VVATVENTNKMGFINAPFVPLELDGTPPRQTWSRTRKSLCMPKNSVIARRGVKAGLQALPLP